MDQEDTANLDWLGSKSENGSISGVLDDNPADRILDRHEEQEDHAVHVQKKVQTGGEDGKGGGLDNYAKRVAEIVLVLAAMGRIRGGRNPTVVERELMAEARQKLSRLCESLPPRQLLTKEAVGALANDLGLNWLKDQKSEIRPKTSIAEKVLLTMRKIEELREFGTLPATDSSKMCSLGFATSAASHGFFHGINKFPPEKPSPVTPLGVGSQAASLVHQFSAPASASNSINQPQINEVKQTTICKAPERDSLLFALLAPESIHFRLDKQSDGPARLLPVRGLVTVLLYFILLEKNSVYGSFFMQPYFSILALRCGKSAERSRMRLCTSYSFGSYRRRCQNPKLETVAEQLKVYGVEI